MRKNILVPTDFSDNAYNALAYAVQLFKDNECDFYLLNTYTPMVMDTEPMMFDYHTTLINPAIQADEIHKENSEIGLEEFEKRIKEEFGNPKHAYKKISAFNFLSDEIKKQVEEKDIELIVMGTQGATGAKEVFIGTQTMDVMDKTDFPLLAIPAAATFRPLKKVLFPTDFRIRYSESYFKILKSIIEAFNAELHILHVHSGFLLNERELEVKKSLENVYFKNVKKRLHLVEDKRIPKAIMEFCDENNVDFLTMINNKHSFLENIFFKPVVKEVGFHVKLPFLVIPSEKGSSL